MRRMSRIVPRSSKRFAPPSIPMCTARMCALRRLAGSSAPGRHLRERRLRVRDPLAHVDRDPALEGFLAVDCKTVPAVEVDVSGELGVGVEPQLAKLQRTGDLFGMRHEQAAVTLALESRADGDILDQKVVAF